MKALLIDHEDGGTLSEINLDKAIPQETMEALNDEYCTLIRFNPTKLCFEKASIDCEFDDEGEAIYSLGPWSLV